MNEITIPALQSPASLGQLWIKSQQGISRSCWDGPFIQEHTIKEAHPFTGVEYTDITSYEERTMALKIKGEYRVHILFKTLKGSGEYVDTSQAILSSHEVSISCTTTTLVERLTARPGDVSPDQLEAFQRLGATHVVTQIIYGGKFIANFRSGFNQFSSETHTSGGVLGPVLRKAGKELQSTLGTEGYKKAADQFNSSWEQHGVFSDYKLEPIPNTAVEALEAVSSFPDAVKNATDAGTAIPCYITLTPITNFVINSIVSQIIHTMKEDQIEEISMVFDKIVSLLGLMQELKLTIQGHPTLLSSLVKRSQDAINELRTFIAQARDKLQTYTTLFRTDGEVGAGTVEQFVAGLNDERKVHDNLYFQRRREYKSIDNLVNCAVMQDAPFMAAAELRSVLSTGDHLACIVLVPADHNLSELQNMFRITLPRLRARRDQQAVRPLKYLSYYVEEGTLTELLQLDDDKKTLTGIKDRLKRAEVIMVYQDVLPNDHLRTGWFVLNETGWGVIANPDETWVYIGEVQKKVPEGMGFIRYADHSTYEGQWKNGLRNGKGVGPEGPGTYINDQRV